MSVYAVTPGANTHPATRLASLTEQNNTTATSITPPCYLAPSATPEADDPWPSPASPNQTLVVPSPQSTLHRALSRAVFQGIPCALFKYQKTGSRAPNGPQPSRLLPHSESRAFSRLPIRRMPMKRQAPTHRPPHRNANLKTPLRRPRPTRPPSLRLRVYIHPSCQTLLPSGSKRPRRLSLFLLPRALPPPPSPPVSLLLGGWEGGLLRSSTIGRRKAP